MREMENPFVLLSVAEIPAGVPLQTQEEEKATGYNPGKSKQVRLGFKNRCRFQCG